jgi:NADH dehydrogenase
VRQDTTHRVVIVVGGFGGLYAARQLGRAGIPVTMIDRRNSHFFQPLLYQVATGGLSPGDVSAPLRSVLKRDRLTKVLVGDVAAVDTAAAEVVLSDDRRVSYDSLIVAAGMRYHYFGNHDWEQVTGSLKTVEDANRHSSPHLLRIRAGRSRAQRRGAGALAAIRRHRRRSNGGRVGGGHRRTEEQHARW